MDGQASRVAMRVELLEQRHAQRRLERMAIRSASNTSSGEGASPSMTNNAQDPAGGIGPRAPTKGQQSTPSKVTSLQSPQDSPVHRPTSQLAGPPASGPLSSPLLRRRDVPMVQTSHGLADLIGAVAAELMGFYLLSSVLMMRGSLPLEFRAGISEAAGDLEFEFYHHFFPIP